MAIIFIIALIIYFLPTIIANASDKKNTAAIAVVNIFLGWTLIGWVVSLAWSVTSEGIEEKEQEQSINRIIIARPAVLSKTKIYLENESPVVEEKHSNVSNIVSIAFGTWLIIAIFIAIANL